MLSECSSSAASRWAHILQSLLLHFFFFFSGSSVIRKTKWMKTQNGENRLKVALVLRVLATSLTQALNLSHELSRVACFGSISTPNWGLFAGKGVFVSVNCRKVMACFCRLCVPGWFLGPGDAQGQSVFPLGRGFGCGTSRVSPSHHPWRQLAQNRSFSVRVTQTPCRLDDWHVPYRHVIFFWCLFCGSTNNSFQKKKKATVCVTIHLHTQIGCRRHRSKHQKTSPTN